MKVELAPEEAWELMSLVVARMIEGAALPAAERAKVRRWRSQAMRPGSESMKQLTRKINGDLADTIARKKRSPIRKPDWR